MPDPDVVASVAAQQFSSSGLPFPTVPVHLADRLRRRGEWWFDTEYDDAPPYALDDHVHHFVDGPGEDSALVAHAGHGANSWAIHYYVVAGSVGVFIQSSWGGAYTTEDDDRRERDTLAARFAGVDEILATADEVGDRLLGDHRRLAVVVSDLGTSRWAVIEPGVEIDWHDVADPLAAALAWLRRS